MATIPADDRSKTVTLGSASAGPFLVGFRLFSNTDLKVYVNNVERSDFEISASYVDGYSDNASITFDAALDGADILRIDGYINPDRAEDYINGEPNIVAKLNAELGRSAAALQELRRDADKGTAGLERADDAYNLADSAYDLAQAGATSVTLDKRTDLITYRAGGQFSDDPEGTVYRVDGDDYVKATGVRFIPDLDDMAPSGDTTSFRTFGALGNAVISADRTSATGTDDTAAIQAAFTWQQARKGRKLLGKAGAVYLVTDTITTSGEDINVDFRGATIFKNSSGTLFSFPPATIRYYDLSANYTKGALTIPVSTTTTALDVGQPFIVLSDAIAPYNRDSEDNANQFRVAEWAFAATGTTATSIALKAPLSRVRGISTANADQGIVTAGSFVTGRSYTILTVGSTDFTAIGAASNTKGVTFTATGAGTGTGTATSDEARIDAFTTAQSARIAIPAIKLLNVRNARIMYAEGHGQGSGSIWQGTAFSVFGYTGEFANIDQQRGYDGCIQLNGTVNMKVTNCTARHLENNTGDNQYGYGVEDKGYGTVVDNCRWDFCRHGYTTGSASITAGEEGNSIIAAAGPYGCTIRDCVGTNTGAQAAFDTHHGCENITFINCKSDRTEEEGFAIRGINIRLVSPVVRNSSGRGMFLFTDDNNTGGADDRSLAGKTQDDYTSVTVIDADIESIDVPFHVKWARAYISGYTRTRTAGHKLFDIQGVIVFNGIAQHEHTLKDGAWTANAQNAEGVINLIEPGNHPSDLVWPTSRITVRRGSDIVCECGDATSTGTFGVNMPNTDCQIVNRGRVKITLPSDGKLFSASGNATTSDGGVFEIELDASLDDANDHNLTDRRAAVFSTDGRVRHGGFSVLEFSTRAAAIAALSKMYVGQHFKIGDLQFQKVASSSAISDMSNVIPAGDTSVKHFGATGDGSTDDTAALQAAIDYMEANNGGKLHWPDGVYVITDTLTQTGDCIRHIGGAFEAADLSLVEDGYAQFLANAPVVIQWDSGTTGDKMFRITIADETGAGRVAMGNGMDGIVLDGQNVATIGLELISQRGGRWNVASIRCTSANFSFGVCLNGVANAAGTSGDGNASMTDNVFRLFGCNRGIGGNTAYTLVCWGTGADFDGNVSLNTFESCTFFGAISQHLHFGDTDGNTLVGCRWGGSLTWHADDTLSGWGSSEQKSRHNVIIGGQGSIIAKASTTTGQHSWGNVVYGYSTGNSISLPTIEDGADMTIFSTGPDQASRLGGLAYGKAHAGVRVTRDAAQTIPTGVPTVVSFNSIGVDPLDAVDGSYNITVPNGIKYANITFRWAWENNSTGARLATILLNGSATADDRRVASNESFGSLTTGIISVSPGDTIGARVFQNSGGDLDLTADKPVLSVEFL
jgi:hypothetical protein